MMVQRTPRQKNHKQDVNVLQISALFVWLLALLFNTALVWHWFSSPDVNVHMSKCKMR